MADRAKVDVKAITAIARIALTDGECRHLEEQLNLVLGYVDQLMAVDVEGVEPAAYPIPTKNVLAADEPRPGFGVEEALMNAPRRKGDLLAVPQILRDE
jgi:aspartyl-tRNA(Asn)/glutamyl-tRNA(Gln) amidotransferase subunit C